MQSRLDAKGAVSPVVAHGPATWLGRVWVAVRGGVVVDVGFGPDPPYPFQDDVIAARVAADVAGFLEGAVQRVEAPLFWDAMPPVHAEMMRILYENVPWGHVVSYGELASLAGYPGAARAAGTACRHCPFFPIVPCHRVIAAHGRLGGFLGRPDVKKRLLEAEGLGPFPIRTPVLR